MYSKHDEQSSLVLTLLISSRGLMSGTICSVLIGPGTKEFKGG